MLLMDDHETLHRRARLRELISACFEGRTANLIRYIEARTGKQPNQGELSAIQKDHGKSFGDKKARALTEQIGLPRRWFELPLGSMLSPDEWKAGEAEEGALLSPQREPAGLSHPTLRASEPSSAQKPHKGPYFVPRTSPLMPHYVPVLDWENALVVRTLFDREDLQEWPRTPYEGPHAGRRIVAIRQDDASMQAPAGGGPSFVPGTQYIIDIDRPAKINDFVLFEKGGRAYLRRLVADVSGRRLIPLNPQFEPAPDTGDYLGVLVEATPPPIYKIE